MKMKPKLKLEIARYVPVGINYRQELSWIGAGLILSFLYSLGFVFRYSGAYRNLFLRVAGEDILQLDARMPGLAELLDDCFLGFYIVALCMAALFAYHYFYHYQGSKSIYLMRRLPKKTELWLRCAALPLLTAVAALLAAAILLALYYCLYRAVTPESCLPPQWGKLWAQIQ